MNGKSALAGSRAKLSRADEHFQALNDAVKEFAVSQTEAVRGDIEQHDGETFYVMRAHKIEPVPNRVGAILGDAFQNMRAALDHAVWALISKPNRRNRFPICRTEPAGEDLDRYNAAVRGLSDCDRRLIEHVQPYKGSDPANHALAVLARFSNIDKHQVILASALNIVFAPDQLPEYTPHDLDVLGQLRLTYDKRLEPGTEIFRVPVRVAGPNPGMEVHGAFPVGVAFGKDRHPLPDLSVVREYVGKLIKGFEEPSRVRFG